MQHYTIVEEKDVIQLLTMPLAITVIERCFQEKAEGSFQALPKINIAGKNGDLRITPGESITEFNAIGFRVYDLIRTDFNAQEQVIVVYDNTTGKLRGVVISQIFGAYRTAAINAVMQSFFVGDAIECLGVVGTGFQAKVHVRMFNFLLRPKQIKVYGRTKEHVKQFVSELNTDVGDETRVEICAEIDQLKNVDSLLLATSSPSSLLDPEIFQKNMVITTIGPKQKGRSEVSSEFAESCDTIVTDSIEQVLKYGDNFFIQDVSKVQDFADVLKGKEKRKNQPEKVLLCSVGMGGTEVALANELIKLKMSS
jgi:ornithine cyclodeaminase